jgi:hypothetical protein
MHTCMLHPLAMRIHHTKMQTHKQTCVCYSSLRGSSVTSTPSTADERHGFLCRVLSLLFDTQVRRTHTYIRVHTHRIHHAYIHTAYIHIHQGAAGIKLRERKQLQNELHSRTVIL